MSQVLRTEAADLQVILDDGEGLAQLVHGGFEELPLEIVARTPRQVTAHVQPFALDMQEHVVGKDTFGRIGVVGAAGGVDVVIAAVVAIITGVDPALELNADMGVALLRDGDRTLQLTVFGSSTKRHGELARRQQDRAAIVAVNLLLKEKVGCQTLGLRRVNVIRLIAEREASRRRFAIDVGDRQLDLNAGTNIEEDRHFAAETEILGSLANVEAKRRLAFARFAAVK